MTKMLNVELCAKQSGLNFTEIDLRLITCETHKSDYAEATSININNWQIYTTVKSNETGTVSLGSVYFPFVFELADYYGTEQIRKFFESLNPSYKVDFITDIQQPLFVTINDTADMFKYLVNGSTIYFANAHVYDAFLNATYEYRQVIGSLLKEMKRRNMILPTVVYDGFYTHPTFLKVFEPTFDRPFAPYMLTFVNANISFVVEGPLLLTDLLKRVGYEKSYISTDGTFENRLSSSVDIFHMPYVGMSLYLVSD